jgi:hypothetical protein
MSRAAVVSALALSLVGCEPRRGPDLGPYASGAAPSTAPPASASTGAPVTASKLRGQALAAGYGGVGPATPAPHPNVWVVLFVELTATAKLAGIAVASLELLDAEGRVVARATPPWSLRQDTTPDAAARKRDFSEQGTTPFDGEAGTGDALRLRIHAPLDTRAEKLKPAPVRYRLSIHADGESPASVEGPLEGPWPTG